MTSPSVAAEFESLPVDTIIDRLLAEHALAAQRGLFCITCSFQAEDMIVLDFLRRRLPHIPVLFLDTGSRVCAASSRRRARPSRSLSITSFPVAKGS
jgi:3'-phosphoadenosine 5'-phosphosulfate sulfotransferase (PAPS reductase)/FAD synthetase